MSRSADGQRDLSSHQMSPMSLSAGAAAAPVSDAQLIESNQGDHHPDHQSQIDSC